MEITNREALLAKVSRRCVRTPLIAVPGFCAASYELAAVSSLPTEPAAMTSEKRDASPSASTSGGAETPSKRPRLEATDKAEAPAAAISNTAAVQDALRTEAAGEAPSSPAVIHETDSPSSRGKPRGGGRGGRGAGRGGRSERGAGKFGGTGKGRDRNEAPKEGSRNAEAAAKASGPDATPAERATAGANEDDKRDKLPKKKVAVLLGYSGLGYKGSQMCVFRCGFWIRFSWPPFCEADVLSL